MKAPITIFLLLLCLRLVSAVNLLSHKNDASDAFEKAFAYQKVGHLDSALKYYNKALITLPENSPDYPGILVNLSIIYKHQGKYNKALEYAFQCISDDSLSSKISASCYNNIGTIYYHTRDFDKSLKYHYQALKVRKRVSDSIGMARSFNNIGNVFNELDIYDSAISNYSRSLVIKEKANDIKSLVSVLHNIGWVYLKKGDFKKSETHLIQTLKAKTEIGAYNTVVYTTNLLARLYLNKGDLPRSKLFLDSTETMARKYKVLDVVRQNLYDHSIYYGRLGKYKKQANILKEYIIINDSLLNKDKARALTEMQIKYDTDKKEQEISFLKNIELLQKLEIDYQKKLKIVAIISASLFLGVALIIFTFWRTKKRQALEIQLLNQEMQHRISNNLQLLSGILKLQSAQTESISPKEMAQLAEHRINAMAMVHQKLFDQEVKRKIEVHTYLIELCSYLQHSFKSQKRLVIDHRIDLVRLDVDKMVYIGLIVNELVTNAIKYAFVNTKCPMITVSLKTQVSDRILLEIRDNGSGLKENSIQSQSFGTKLIKTLSSQLKCESSHFNENGAVFQFLIPVNS